MPQELRGNLYLEMAGCCSGDAALADRFRCTYREGEKVPFSVTLSEPFFGEFVTENVIRTFSPSLLVHLIRLDTAASPEQQPAISKYKFPRNSCGIRAPPQTPALEQDTIRATTSGSDNLSRYRSPVG